MSDPSVDARFSANQQPIESVQQSADANQATLLAVQQLSLQLKERREHQEQLQKKTQEQLATLMEELRQIKTRINEQ